MTDEQFLFEERAAIIEYMGNVSRQRAEYLAKEQMREANEKRENSPLFNGDA
jgi:hypothetical protein